MRRILTNLTAAVILLLAVLLCFWLDARLPFSIPRLPGIIGWILILVGLAMILLAEAAFLKHGGATGAPADPTKRLVVSGIYRWTRNPIYLGGTLILLGIALMRSSPMLLLSAILFPILMNFTIIPKEEQRLEAEFGGNFPEYRKRVPRWIPRPPK